jgi:hypothetical protein
MEEMSRKERGLQDFSEPDKPKDLGFVTQIETFASRVSEFKPQDMQKVLTLIEDRLDSLDDLDDVDQKAIVRIQVAYDKIKAALDALDPTLKGINAEYAAQPQVI